MNHPDSAAAYVASVLTLYLEMPDTPIRVSASDQWLARHFHQDGLPLETIETALLLGSLRRLIRPADAPRLAPIRSLAYYAPSSTNSWRIQPRKTTATTSGSSYAKPLRHCRQMAGKIRFLMSANNIGSRHSEQAALTHARLWNQQQTILSINSSLSGVPFFQECCKLLIPRWRVHLSGLARLRYGARGCSTQCLDR
jgi:hypothetical protein